MTDSNSNGVADISQAPPTSLEGWECVDDIGGGRWLGKVVAEDGDTLTLCPCFEQLRPSHGHIPVPEQLGGQVHVKVQVMAAPGGELLFPYQYPESLPTAARRMRWAARMALADMDQAARGSLRRAIDGMFSKARDARRVNSLAAVK